MDTAVLLKDIHMNVDTTHLIDLLTDTRVTFSLGLIAGSLAGFRVVVALGIISGIYYNRDSIIESIPHLYASAKDLIS